MISNHAGAQIVFHGDTGLRQHPFAQFNETWSEARKMQVFLGQ